MIVWPPKYKWNIVERGIARNTPAIILAFFCWPLHSCPSYYDVCLTLSLVSSNIPLLCSALPVTVFHYIVLIIYAIFLSFSIEFQWNSAQLAYVVCQCFTFILHTAWRYEDCRWHIYQFTEVTFLGTHNGQTM